MKTIVTTLATLLALNATAETLDNFAEPEFLNDTQSATTESYTYDSVVRYFNANAGRVPPLQELAPSRICTAFEPGTLKPTLAAGLGILSSVDYKLLISGKFANWISQSRSWNAQEVVQARREIAKYNPMANIKNSTNANEFLIQEFRAVGSLVPTIEAKIRKSPTGRYYFIIEGLQPNSTLRVILAAGVCDLGSIVTDSKFPL